VFNIAKLTKEPAVSLIPVTGQLRKNISSPSDHILTDRQKSDAANAYSKGFQSPGSKPILDQDGFTYRFLGKDFGVISFTSELSSRTEIRHAYNSMIDQAIVTLEKLTLTQEAEVAQRTAQREALRSALLSSLSHDLRTPLATILGGVSSLRELGDVMPLQARIDTLLAVEEEAGRLSRYVENLLHMTRLKTGLEIRKVSIDPSDVVRSGVARARRAFSNRPIGAEIASDTPLITADPVLLEQALFNLIDNAIKFSNSNFRVIVGLSVRQDTISIFVKDQGVGIPPSEQQLVLDPFYRGKDADQIGSGLGLAISNGIVSSLGGKIEIESPVKDGMGTLISIIIPVDKDGKL
jgi:two-component system sensor histidine kinase KdpD